MTRDRIDELESLLVQWCHTRATWPDGALTNHYPIDGNGHQVPEAEAWGCNSCGEGWPCLVARSTDLLATNPSSAEESERGAPYSSRSPEESCRCDGNCDVTHASGCPCNVPDHFDEVHIVVRDLAAAEERIKELTGALNGLVTCCRECRDEMPMFSSNIPRADFVLWGKLFPPEAFGPKCYDHAAKHIGWSGMSQIEGMAVVDLRPINRLTAIAPPVEEAWQPSRADDIQRSSADGPERRASWQDDPGQVTDARLADIAADLELAFSGVTVAQMVARIDAQTAELRAARARIEELEGAETMVTYKMADGSSVAGEFGWVSSLDYFDEDDEPSDVVEEVWSLVSRRTITVGPKCHCGEVAIFWGLCEKHAREDDPEHFADASPSVEEPDGA